MIIRTCALSLAAALIAGVTAPQILPRPTVNVHQLRPREQQVESREDNRAGERDARIQSVTDRLYGELMRSSARALR